MKKYCVFMFTVVLFISLTACGGTNSNQPPATTSSQESVTSEQGQSSDTANSTEAETITVDSFIEKYNITAPTPIENPVEIDVTDREGGHYRTEFRLSAFSNSYAKTGKIGDITIDIVNCNRNNDELRIYADDITPEQAVEIVKYAAPIMDPSVSDNELQDVLDYLSGASDYHSGYFGNLVLTFNNVLGQLMLRTS